MLLFSHIYAFIFIFMIYDYKVEVKIGSEVNISSSL